MAEINIEEVWQSAKIKYSFPEGLQLKTVLTEDLNVFWRRKIASLICQQVSRKAYVICTLPYFISTHLLGRLMFHSSIIIISNW